MLQSSESFLKLHVQWVLPSEPIISTPSYPASLASSAHLQSSDSSVRLCKSYNVSTGYLTKSSTVLNTSLDESACGVNHPMGAFIADGATDQ
jgi:hypothetical protein